MEWMEIEDSSEVREIKCNEDWKKEVQKRLAKAKPFFLFISSTLLCTMRLFRHLSLILRRMILAQIDIGKKSVFQTISEWLRPKSYACIKMILTNIRSSAALSFIPFCWLWSRFRVYFFRFAWWTMETLTEWNGQQSVRRPSQHFHFSGHFCCRICSRIERLCRAISWISDRIEVNSSISLKLVTTWLMAVVS